QFDCFKQPSGCCWLCRYWLWSLLG
ncbi:acrB/AcrD/AcrF family protein, partial [Vibrio harveyi]